MFRGQLRPPTSSYLGAIPGNVGKPFAGNTNPGGALTADRFKEDLMRPLLLCSLTFAALAVGGPAVAGKKTATTPANRDEVALRTAGLGTDDTALLRYFRSRTL